MACERYLTSIQELADGTLGPIRRAELELHLESCDACRALLADLERIRNAAASLDRLAPPEHVWLQIAGRLRQEGRVTAPPAVAPRGRHAALLAIAAALVLAVAGSLYMLSSRQSGDGSPAAVAGTPPGGNATGADAVQSIGAELQLAEQHYQNAIAGLEQAMKVEDGALDPQTAGMLKKHLELIDHAIAESRAAVRAEPQSAAALDSLFDALKQKVVLLQNTIALMNEMRKGDAAGAAQIVEGTNKS